MRPISCKNRTRFQFRLVGVLGAVLLGMTYATATAQGTNLIRYSEEFEKWTAIQGATVTPNVTESPNGQMTADRINGSPDGRQPRMGYEVAANGGAYVFSVHLKGGSLPQAVLCIRESGSIRAIEEVSLSSSWRRYALSLPSSNSGRMLRVEVYPGNKGGDNGYVYAWGAQLESGSSMTPYQPTPGGGGGSDPGTPPTDTTPPAAPSGVSATWDGSKVQIRWNANTEADLASYRVERGTGSSSSFSSLGSTNQPTYVDNAVSAGTTYYYQVRALDQAGNVSTASTVASVAVPASGGGDPGDGDPGDGDTGGGDTGGGDTGGGDTGGGDTGGGSGLNLLAFSEEFEKWNAIQGASVAPNVIAAPNGANTADRISDAGDGNQPRVGSNVVTVPSGTYTFSCYLRADSLRAVTLAIRNSGSLVETETFSVNLGWQRFYITARVGAGAQLTAEVYPGSRSRDGGTILAWGAQLEPGSTPGAYVRTPNGDGGGGSNPGTPPTDTTPPTMPSGVSATWDGSRVQVKWSANTEADLAGYRVERGANSSSSFSNLGSATQASYEDGTVVAGNTYYYRVRAVDQAGNVSATSSAAEVKIPGESNDTTPPSAPKSLTGAWDGSKVQLKWTANTESDLASYKVERSTTSNGSFSAVGSSTEASYVDSSVTEDNTYYYRVSAVDKAGNTSRPSNTVSVKVPRSDDTPPTVNGKSRGYLTTPQELAAIKDKAARGIEPYKSAVAMVIEAAGSPTSWEFGTISGNITAGSSRKPDYTALGGPVIYAKAMTYHLTGNEDFAKFVRERILDLLDTSGFGGDTYSGGNQMILNLSRDMPSWIFAADLLEGWSGWSEDDKLDFQKWLAKEIYPKVDWANDERSTNWGADASPTAMIIADYLAGSGVMLYDRNKVAFTPRQAFDEAVQRQKDRIRGNNYMYNSVCDRQDQGIRPDGGIPTELGRDSVGCDAKWLEEMDSSWSYTMSYLEGVTLQAEVLLRRGDRSLYDYIAPDGSGSILRAHHFVLNNPNNPSKSFPWATGRLPQLEIAYRYYKDPYMAKQLGIGGDRYVGGDKSIQVYWTTLTHGFAVGEDPGLPPVTPKP